MDIISHGSGLGKYYMRRSALKIWYVCC